MLTKERIESRAALRPLKQPLYDCGLVAVGPAVNTRIQFFQAPIGQLLGAANKTEADTNMTQAGQIGRPQEFDLYGFQLEVWTVMNAAQSHVPDMQLIYDGSVFEFFFGTQRPWLQVAADRIPNGPGLEGTIATANNAAPVDYKVSHCGIGSGKAMYEFTIGKKPIPIGSAENFNSVLTFRPAGITIAGAAIRVRNYLKGILFAAL